VAWDTGLDKLPTLVPDFELVPGRTALLIVDMQNRAVKPDRYEGLARILRDGYPEAAAYYLGRLETVVPNNVRLLEHFRDRGMRVIFATVGPQLPDGSDFISPFRIGYDEIRARSGIRSLFPVGSPEHRIIDELAPREDELVVNKTTSGAFNSTGIDVTLRHLGIDTLVCTGLVTDACVMTTGRDASDRGYKVVLVDDACAAIEERMHEAALRYFAVFAGVVRNTADVIAATAAVAAQGPPRTLST
jgi:nicotinamidase-related amidase